MKLPEKCNPCVIEFTHEEFMQLQNLLNTASNDVIKADVVTLDLYISIATNLPTMQITWRE